ncbi:uncharacterized protein [Centruroides vittatus]|uniref:uncharacterized protein n=1 Tax=Centruroides vittatus TaxID=120091 RepID=UPI00350FA8C1
MGYAVSKDHVKRKILSAQRTAAISITKAYRTAPTDAMLVIAGLEPIHLVILVKYVKNLLFKLNNSSISPSQFQRLTAVLKLPDSIHNLVKNVIDWGIDVNNHPNSTHPATILNSNIYLNHQVPPKGINFYTDGSKTKKAVGASVYVKDNNSHTYWQSALTLNNHCSINQAESLAILTSLNYIKKNHHNLKGTTININTDSRTALHQIKNNNKKLPIINNSLQILENLSTSMTINLIWIKGHSNIYGNDKADDLAKKAHKITNKCNYNAIPSSIINSIMNNILIEKWQEEWDTSHTGRLTHEFIPRIDDRMKNNFFHTNHAITQILTAHDRQGKDIEGVLSLPCRGRTQ